ncbi:C45 family peptidase [Emcibacter nanhaiensis]|uniref:Linear amide C-N hydrolase n=1 Tax=Emcibacter nanhaiensis TaxID=1505037 RepID=A0A501PGR9_9PROT|nr:C45 family peptidase [Emcibacter nanhaiensis]TPD59278.1 linear amide C-N hydrolase [Emcibacter nanhaiensis]
MLDVKDEVIAGGPDKFLEVRKITLRGSQVDIGAYLAKLARDELGVRKVPWTDPTATRIQRQFLKTHWPEHYARMQGVAEALGEDLEDDDLDFSFLVYQSGIPGCSCVYYPGTVTATGQGLFARNFDFTTGGYADLPLCLPDSEYGQAHTAYGDAGLPYLSRPFLFELHPDTGHSMLFMCAYDLLGGCTDGINSEGLTVALLNDNETAASDIFEPLGRNGVGLSEGQVCRFLLETCATVDDAIYALRTMPHYYMSGPCHYLIADASGNAFVWEYSAICNHGHVIPCDGRAPLAVTNHLLHEHKVRTPPEIMENSVTRLDRLQKEISMAPSPLTAEKIREINRCVQARELPGQGQYITTDFPGRTLWFCLYAPGKRALEIDFYLEENEGDIRRSDILSFNL